MTIRKGISLLATVLMLAPCVSEARHASMQDKEFVLVIDAGHGGKDVGCEGLVTNEKTITLDVARKFRDMVSDSCPEVRTVLTRDDDRYLTLQERADVANREAGDLFVSIHVNSVDRKSKGRTSVQGASVYVLGPDKESKNLSVAMRENAVIELEEDFSENYRGFDPSSTESYIIFELTNNMHRNMSLQFAEGAQNELINTAGRKDKNVRQAGFWVLWATSMPSVLVELDFICNPKQEAFLNSEEGRQKCAQALYNAFSQYLGAYQLRLLSSHQTQDSEL